MELQVINYIYIDVDEIIENHNLNMETPKEQVYNAIYGYVCGLDDDAYYSIGSIEIDKIYAEIRARTGEQLSLPI